jgi:hypothetical protein
MKGWACALKNLNETTNGIAKKTEAGNSNKRWAGFQLIASDRGAGPEVSMGVLWATKSYLKLRMKPRLWAYKLLEN